MIAENRERIVEHLIKTKKPDSISQLKYFNNQIAKYQYYILIIIGDPHTFLNLIS